MRRGPKPAKSKVESKPPAARKSVKDADACVRDLEKRLADALRDKAEAQEQQKATSEVLRTIAHTQSDMQPVLDALTASATRLCDAVDAYIFRVDAQELRLVAHNGPIAALPIGSCLPLVRETVVGRTVLEARTVHVADVQSEASEFPESQKLAERLDYRTVLNVPLMHEGVAIGLIGIRRAEARLFTERQIALLQTFADQAVIAIENVRLFNETREALDQQTATSEILRVISSSPTDAEPVFEAITQSALRLCDGTLSVVSRYDGELIHLGAYTHVSAEGVELIRRRFPMQPMRDNLHGRVVLEGGVVHIPDVQADSEFNQAISQALGSRSTLGVPMLLDGRVVGAIAVARPDVRPFTDKQIALLQTFADQAVIAIENVRLFTELQEKNEALTEAHAQVTDSLDQQTATAEILKVISSSPTDVQPVFEAIADSAMRLFGAWSVGVDQYDGDLMRLAAARGGLPGSSEAYMARRQWRQRPSQDTAVGRALRTGVVHIVDVEADPSWGAAFRQHAAERGFRSFLMVPMRRGPEAVGDIAVTRAQPGGFSPGEIALLQTFADQAVIAIENVRLFNETKEALEQQTATGDILKVIASSPTEIQPVLDTVAESAARLCESSDAEIFRRESDRLLLVAHHGPIPSRASTVPVVRGTINGRAILDGRTLHVADLQKETAEFPLGRELARQNDTRAHLVVPLMREGVAIGSVSVRRTEARLFTERQIALLQTFADQAVIAIENVRLFKELETRNHDLTEALDRQTATAEILRVISQSQTEVQPVFDTIVRNAVRLCGASYGGVYRFDGTLVHSVAHDGYTPEQLEHWRRQWPKPVTAGNVACRAINTRSLVRIGDVEKSAELHELTSDALANIRARGIRSVLTVPMFRQQEIIGAISLGHRDLEAFSNSHVELLKTFADQAVIAIENARLLTELQARTGELTRSVEQLTALGDVGRAVSSSLDLDTVLSTIVGRAVQLSGTDGGTIFEYDEIAEEFMARATLNADEGQSALLRATRLRRGEGAVGQMAVTRHPIQIPDIAAEGAYESRIRGAMLEAGTRSVLAIPLLHEEQLVGGLVVTRRVPGGFTADVVELLRTFATQSALAIQNARLFREIEDKSRQLEVASQHKSEFLANMSHELRTPLNAIIGFSEVLTDRMFGELNEKQEEYLKDINASGGHLLSLINDILDLSKIEAGRMELELTDFDLPTAIENALTLVRERAGRRSIALHTNIDTRLGQIQADERKVRQVVLNLLSNAIKFTPEGGRIDVGAVPKNRFVEISVSDTGIGIAPEDQEKVFEEFRQVGTAAKKIEGTGLGLTLCRKFVELHGGRIWVKSELGVGSTFTFTIPLRRAD